MLVASVVAGQRVQCVQPSRLHVCLTHVRCHACQHALYDAWRAADALLVCIVVVSKRPQDPQSGQLHTRLTHVRRHACQHAIHDAGRGADALLVGSVGEGKSS